MRSLLVLALLAGCPSSLPFSGEELDGACELGDAQCVDDRTIQYCDGETWSEAEECPPEETAVGPVMTYCFEAGFCGPG